MQFKDGKKQITKAVSLDEDDATAFRELDRLHITLDLRVLKTDPKTDILKLIDERFN